MATNETERKAAHKAFENALFGETTLGLTKALDLALDAAAAVRAKTEVSDEMTAAGMKEWDKQHRAGERQWPRMLAAVYRAMLSASGGNRD